MRPCPALASVVVQLVAVACGGRSASHTTDASGSGSDGALAIDAQPDAPCTTCAPLTTSWDITYGGSGFDNIVQAIWVDAAGNTYVTGEFDGTIEIGGQSLTSAGDPDIVVASFGPSGTYRWAQRFGGSGIDEGAAIVVAGGSAYVGGWFTSDVDFGGGTVTGAGGLDALLLVLDATTGAYTAAYGFGTAGNDYTGAIGVDGSGNITIAGEFAAGTLELDGSAISGSANVNAYVASFTAAGNARWSRTLAGSPPVAPATSAFDQAYGLAVDDAGNVTVVGAWMGTTDFGSGTITSSNAANLMSDAFVASYTSAGVPRWSQSFGGGDGDGASAVAVDASGNVVVGGGFHSTVDFGGTELTQQGVVDGFALALAGSTGVVAMARSIGDSERSVISGVRADSQGNVVVTGDMEAASTDLGNGVVLVSPGGGEDDTFVAGFDRASGSALFGKRWGGSGSGTYAEPDALALSVHDSMAIGGVLSGPVDLGTGPLTTGSDATGFAMLVTR